jgi:hypothetical protein
MKNGGDAPQMENWGASAAGRDKTASFFADDAGPDFLSSPDDVRRHIRISYLKQKREAKLEHLQR